MNLSGYGINKVFKTGPNPVLPYYYIKASLDLSNAVYGGNYYFNYDNSFEYATNRDYSRFVTVDENMLISEVVVYSDPDMIKYDPESEVYFSIGGAESVEGKPSGEVKVYWAAPFDFGNNNNQPGHNPHYNGYPLDVSEVNGGSVNYYGHEGGHFPYFKNNANTTDSSVKYKYLAVSLKKNLPTSGEPNDPRNLEQEVKIEEPVADPVAPSDPVGAPNRSIKEPRKKKVISRGLPTGEKAIVEGKLTVVLKIYPKTQ